MTEPQKMHQDRVLRRIIEEENEYGNGFRLKITVDPDAPLDKYVSLDLIYRCEGEDTEDSVGVILSPQAAFDIARNLEKAAYSIIDKDDTTNG